MPGALFSYRKRATRREDGGRPSCRFLTADSGAETNAHDGTQLAMDATAPVSHCPSSDRPFIKLPVGIASPRSRQGHQPVAADLPTPVARRPRRRRLVRSSTHGEASTAPSCRSSPQRRAPMAAGCSFLWWRVVMVGRDEDRGKALVFIPRTGQPTPEGVIRLCRRGLCRYADSVTRGLSEGDGAGSRDPHVM